MDFLVNVVLPLSLAIIMLSLGIGLTVSDFKRVAERGFPFLIGAVCQAIILPIIAYLIVVGIGLSGEIAVGVMLLAFCPGGVTSNILSKLAHGDVALSVSLTAVVSLLSILTVPFLVGWAVVRFMGADAPDVSVTSLAIAMFLITTLPVIIGMSVRAFAPNFATKVEPKMVTLSTILFALIIVAALAGNWGVFLDNLSTLGPAVAILIVTMLCLALGVARAFGLTVPERKTISVEAGIQNGTLGITLAPIIVGATGALPVMAMPSAMYGVFMYLIGIPFVLWLRRQT